jgi:hypothetical protein
LEERVAQHRPRAGTNEHAEQHAEDQVGVLPAGGDDDDAGRDDAEQPECVAGELEEGCAEVEIFTTAPEDESGAVVT